MAAKMYFLKQGKCVDWNWPADHEYDNIELIKCVIFEQSGKKIQHLKISQMTEYTDSNTTQISNFKSVGSKLWQCSRFLVKGGGRDVIDYVNELKLKRTQLDIKGTICRKFHWNRPSSFGVLARKDTDTDTHRYTDTHTDIQTDRQPGIFRPERSQ